MQHLFVFASEHIILISMWCLCLMILIFFSIKNIFLSANIINHIQAITLINQHQAVIVDTRDKAIFEQGHILNSINIPLNRVFCNHIDEIRQYKIFPIILILQHTYEYNECVKVILKCGFKDVYILKNCLDDWNLNHLPLVAKESYHK